MTTLTEDGHGPWNIHEVRVATVTALNVLYSNRRPRTPPSSTATAQTTPPRRRPLQRQQQSRQCQHAMHNLWTGSVGATIAETCRRTANQATGRWRRHSCSALAETAVNEQRKEQRLQQTNEVTNERSNKQMK